MVGMAQEVLPSLVSEGRRGRDVTRPLYKSAAREPVGRVPEMRRLGDEERERSDKRMRQEAMKSPEGRWRLKLQNLTEAEILDLVRIHLEKEPLEDPVERRAFVDAVNSTGMVQHWRRGSKKDPRTPVGKKKLRERARLLAGVRE